MAEIRGGESDNVTTFFHSAQLRLYYKEALSFVAWQGACRKVTQSGGKKSCFPGVANKIVFFFFLFD